MVNWILSNRTAEPFSLPCNWIFSKSSGMSKVMKYLWILPRSTRWGHSDILKGSNHLTSLPSDWFSDMNIKRVSLSWREGFETPHSQSNDLCHEDMSTARACSADLLFQRSAWAEMIMQEAPEAPSMTIKVIRGAPPLHIQPYGETMDRWIFKCRIVDQSPQMGLGSLPYSRSAEFNTEQTLSLSFIQVSNLRLSLVFSPNSRYQPIYLVPT